MADFCLEHFKEMYPDIPQEKCDMAGLCQPGYEVEALCEHCGYVVVDHTGKALARFQPNEPGGRSGKWIPMEEPK